MKFLFPPVIWQNWPIKGSSGRKWAKHLDIFFATHLFQPEIVTIIVHTTYRQIVSNAQISSVLIHTKGQLISKCLFGIFNCPKKWTKKFDFTTNYGTSSRIVFVRFLGELMTTKRHFEINWPLRESEAQLSDN